MNKRTAEMLGRLQALGTTGDDALALRRISMTLSRWFDLECGDGNKWGSWAIERDEKTEVPYMVYHRYSRGQGKDTVTRTRIADRETGARKRLAAIMARYPSLIAYVQTDPRGASLYVLRRSDIPEGQTDEQVDQFYTRGIAVHK
jgi:hypothetical protein